MDEKVVLRTERAIAGFREKCLVPRVDAAPALREFPYALQAVSCTSPQELNAFKRRTIACLGGIVRERGGFDRTQLPPISEEDDVETAERPEAFVISELVRANWPACLGRDFDT